MTSQGKPETNNLDVWSSIRNLKKKMRSSKTENEITSLLQKSQNSTKFSSNTSMISQKEFNISQKEFNNSQKEMNYSEKANKEENLEEKSMNRQILHSNSEEEEFSKNTRTSLKQVFSNEIYEEIHSFLKENEDLKRENKKLESVIENLMEVFPI